MTPKLRFPEFSGDWQVKHLSDISDFQEGPGILAVDFRESGIPLIRLSGLSGSIVTKAGCNYLSPDKVEHKWQHFKLRIEDMLLSTSGTLGAVSEVGEEAEGSIAYTGIIRFRPILEQASKGYLKHLLTSDDFQKQAANMSTGAVLHHFGPTHLKQMKYLTPLVDEQQKIADFLTAVDDRVVAQQQKVELLKKYKKGVMQKIFNQQIHFKDENGRNYSDWQESKAGDLFDNISNRHHDGDLPVLSVTQNEGVVVRNSLDRKINQSDAGIKNYKIIEPDDFVISLRSFQGGIEMSNVLGISSPAYTVLRASPSVISEMFKHYFKREEFVSRLNETVIGIRDGKQISYGPFSTLRLHVPSKSEQQKIADFLTSLDGKIRLEEAKLTAAKTYKKGLLQRMFV